MKNLFFSAVAMAMSLFLGSCTDSNKVGAKSKPLTGKESVLFDINGLFLARLKYRLPTTDTIIVTSSGGKPSSGIKIAREIYDNQLNIIVAEICLSACAEYVLPAANNEINLIHEPLIGYHWNPIILAHLLRKNATKDYEYCTKIGDEELLELLSDTGKNPDAWMETLERINLVSYQVVYKENQCPWSTIEFENKFWFPTTEQLNDIFGLQVYGKLCADNPVCYNKKIPYHFRNGGSFIVGDEKIVVPKRIIGKNIRIELENNTMPEIKIKQ